MGISSGIRVEVAYAYPHEQCILNVSVEEGATIVQVIEKSGILERFPEIDLAVQQVGIFSVVKSLGYRVEAGDRVEIYRPLVMDPKEARRVRAKK